MLKNAEKHAKGKQCRNYFKYLNDMEKLVTMKAQSNTVEDFLEIGNIE